MKKERAQQLADKIDHEGGLPEFVIGYGGTFGDLQLDLAAENLKYAYTKLKALADKKIYSQLDEEYY